jgi:tRNA1(Val) A37 N6-methylase TrmN6
MTQISPNLFGETPAAPPVPPQPRSRQAQLGQYLTPESVSSFMAGLFPKPPCPVRLLDAGAGAGALTAAFVHRWGDTAAITAHAYELDELMLPKLQSAAAAMSARHGIDMAVIEGDFIAQAAQMIRLSKGPRYTHAILNPPYKKIATASDHRAYLRSAGLETVNLYSGFVGLSLALMEEGGELVAIIPRSFCNGPYYQPFRRFVLARAAIRQIHLFESRNKAFRKDGVLQENVIIRMTRGGRQGAVVVSTSTDDSFADLQEITHPFASIVFPDDPHEFIHIPTGDDKDMLAGAAFAYRLEDLDLAVSTGPVVDFRMRAALRADPENGTVPLLYAGHFSGGAFEWPKAGFKKPNAILHNRETAKWLFPTGFYTVVRRFSSKEERRRIVANVVEPQKLPQPDALGFENHLNVFHDRRRPLDEWVARGLAVYLNASAVDRYFRRFNGHTQVNATDLRTMRYPSRQALVALGKWAKKNGPLSQEAIDAQVGAIE